MDVSQLSRMQVIEEDVMQGRIRQPLTGVVLVLAVAALVGGLYQIRATHGDVAATPPPGNLVDVGGHRLHIWCTGSGAPTVVLEAGWGGTAFDWGYVQPLVAQFTHVCSYDRAGMGYSDTGPQPRTTRQIADELAMLIERSAVHGRVVIVGASAGGWNARLFASTHEERVAGLVLVDARHEDHGQRLAAVGFSEDPPWIARLVTALAHLGIARGLGFTPGPALDSIAQPVRRFAEATAFRSSAFATTAGEMRDADKSARQVAAASRHTLTMPLIVVSAGRRRGLTGRPRNDRAAELLDALQRDQLKLSSRSCQVVARQSGHEVWLEQPRLVVEAIRATVEASRKAGVAPDCASVTRESPQRGSRIGQPGT